MNKEWEEIYTKLWSLTQNAVKSASQVEVIKMREKVGDLYTYLRDEVEVKGGLYEDEDRVD